MSNSAVLTASPSPSSTGNSYDDFAATPTRLSRGDMTTGKGRRRRATAEQRRAEQQNWSRHLHDTEEEDNVAPPRPPVSRRQLRRALRRSLNQDWEEDDDDIDVALALSLSMAEQGGGAQDMSYESLVRLENVTCTAPPATVDRLTGHVFNKDAKGFSTDCGEEICTICQVELKDGDVHIILPCWHTFHDTCGSEWFLKHSKLCPVCKHDITEGV